MPPGRVCKRRNVGGAASPASAEIPAASNAESATKSVPPRRVNIASAWKYRLTARTPSTSRTAFGACSPEPRTTACGTAARMRVVISRSKPFITLVTTVRIATPRVRPAKDTQLTKAA